jgi:transposase
MDIRYFIGVDISKATLDWAVFDGKIIVLQSQSANSEAGIKATLKLIKGLPEFRTVESVCCMEHTGIYNAHLLTHLYKLSFPLWLESSLQIKKAGGLQRGKTDAIDAQRIAEYAFRFRDQLRFWQPPRPVLQKLTALSSLRQRLKLVRRQLQQPLTEQQGFIDAALQKQLSKNCQASLKALDADLDVVNKQINDLIKQDSRLNELFEWITSVPGIGPATATEVIVATNEFKAINDPKKLACHAGVAPFEYKSGSSVRGKTRVNQHARLRLKSVFHLGAMSAIRMKGELGDYYQRKVGEGKNKMSVLNAVRNKLIHRVCSVVHRGQKYDKNYTPAFA